MCKKKYTLKLILSSCLFGLWTVQAHSITFDDLSVNGYFSFEYENQVSGDEEGDTNGSFDLDLVDLVFNFQVSDRVRVAVDVTWEHGAATEDGRGNSAVEYAFAEYTGADWFKMRGGKMFTYFGIYNEIHTAKPAYLTVKEPLSTNKNNKLGSNIRFYPRWQTGLAFMGEGALGSAVEMSYVLQVSNGESDDTNPFEEDDNTHKALNGRLVFSFIDSIAWGLSFYQDDMENGDGTETAEINSYGTHLVWVMPWETSLEFEYVMGDEQIGVADTIDRSAYSLMFSHPFGKFTPYLRVESLEPNDDIDDDEATLTVLGVNYRYNKGVHLKLEIDQFESDDNNDDLEGADYTELKASVSIGF